MNEFYLGALDLSPYIVSVRHKYYKEFWAKLDRFHHDADKVYPLLKEIRDASLYTSSLCISFDGRTYGFLVAIDWADAQSMTFTIRRGKEMDWNTLMIRCPLMFSEQALKTGIMA